MRMLCNCSTRRARTGFKGIEHDFSQSSNYSHGRIENCLHWVLDVAFDEDTSRVRKDHAPENLAVVRHLALNLLNQEKTARGGVKARRLKAGWDNHYLAKVLSQ